MGVALPPVFVDKMKHLLGAEFEDFMASYDAPRYYGIRVNTLKIAVDQFKELTPFTLRSIPWVREGFYIEENARPGKHPYYHAGLYYIQEPSAMAPVELLDIQANDRVLDLCAAPGGKSTQIAAKLHGTGVLVTNDNHPERTKALAKNIELYGVRNAVVLNALPADIAQRFPHYFDKILVDAPCSGEGMFRKDEDMVKQWETHSVERCVAMQRDILHTVAQLLAPGGRIVYSTCTFSPEENEAMIAEFLMQHPAFKLLPIGEEHGFARGRGEWLTGLTDEAGHLFPTDIQEALHDTGRLWPHRIEGEGHYLAVLVHSGVQEVTEIAPPAPERKHKKELRDASPSLAKTALTKDELELVQQFLQQQLTCMLPGHFLRYGQYVYLTPVESSKLEGIKVARPGFFIGTLKKNRFEPSHPLATALRSEESVRCIQLSSDSEQAIRYLRGETLNINEDEVIVSDSRIACKGYALICIDGYSVGWGKWLNGMLKNEYPTGWRWT